MDRRPALFALTVLLSVPLAGCGALGGGGEGGGLQQGSGAGAATPTLTPAPIPEVTEPEPTLPPGVTGTNVTDVDALVDAHVRAVRGRSYTLSIRVRVGEDVSRRLFRVETPRRYYQHDQLAEPWGNATQFADGETLYTRIEYTSATEYGRFDDPDPPRSQTVQLSRAFLRVDGVRVAETRVDGDPAYELTGFYPVHPAVSTLHNFSLRAVVEPSGFIRSMNVSYYRPNDDADVTRSFAYTDVDATTVERPDWVAERWNVTDASG